MKRLFTHPLNKVVAKGALYNLVIGNLVFLLHLMLEGGLLFVVSTVYFIVISILLAFTSFVLLVNCCSSPKDIKEHLIPIFLVLLNATALILFPTFLI